MPTMVDGKLVPISRVTSRPPHHIQMGAVETKLVAKPNVTSSLWAHLKSRQTTPVVATMTKGVLAVTELNP